MSEQEPTSLSTDGFHPLEVGWLSHIGGQRQEDGSFKRVTRHKVSLSMPANPYRKRMRLVNMSPETALNLLKWLEQERDAGRLVPEEGAEGKEKLGKDNWDEQTNIPGV